MTREERDAHVDTIKCWITHLRAISHRDLVVHLAALAGRRGAFSLGLAEADARLERRSKAA